MNRNTTEPPKKTRTRRILSLEERVQVIREYERKPIYQQMAYMFNCSSDQIKSIIGNKESILQYYSNIVNGAHNESHVIRQKKIVFLGKLMYEFVQRAQYHHNVPLEMESIRHKAMEFKKFIKIENFFPNNTWMNNFKNSYRLTFPMRHRQFASPRQTLPSLDLSNIISFVSRREQKEHPSEMNGLQTHQPLVPSTHQYDDEDDECIAAETGPLVKYEEEVGDNGGGGTYDIYGYGAHLYPEVVQLESDDDDDNYNSHPPPEKIPRAAIVDSMPTGRETASVAAADSPMTKKMKKTTTAAATTTTTTTKTIQDVNQIASYDEAMRYLEPLEEFALHQENYRAIGLISQLEAIFRSTPKLGD